MGHAKPLAAAVLIRVFLQQRLGTLADPCIDTVV